MSIFEKINSSIAGTQDIFKVIHVADDQILKEENGNRCTG